MLQMLFNILNVFVPKVFGANDISVEELMSDCNVESLKYCEAESYDQSDEW